MTRKDFVTECDRGAITLVMFQKTTKVLLDVTGRLKYQNTQIHVVQWLYKKQEQIMPQGISMIFFPWVDHVQNRFP